MTDSLIVTFDIENRPALTALDQMRRGFQQFGETAKTAIAATASGDEQAKRLDYINSALERQRRHMEALATLQRSQGSKVANAQAIKAAAVGADVIEANDDLAKQVTIHEQITRKMDAEQTKYEKQLKAVRDMNALLERASRIGIQATPSSGLTSLGDIKRFTSELKSAISEREKAIAEYRKSGLQAIGARSGLATGTGMSTIEQIKKQMEADAAKVQAAGLAQIKAFGSRGGLATGTGMSTIEQIQKQIAADNAKMEAERQARAMDKMRAFAARGGLVTGTGMSTIEQIQKQMEADAAKVSKTSEAERVKANEEANKKVEAQMIAHQQRVKAIIEQGRAGWWAASPQGKEFGKAIHGGGMSGTFMPVPQGGGRTGGESSSVKLSRLQEKMDRLSVSLGSQSITAEERAAGEAKMEKYRSKAAALAPLARQDLSGLVDYNRQFTERMQAFNKQVADLERQRVEMTQRHHQRSNVDRARRTQSAIEENRKEVAEVEAFNRKLAQLMSERTTIVQKMSGAGLGSQTGLLAAGGPRAQLHNPGVGDFLAARTEGIRGAMSSTYGAVQGAMPRVGAVLGGAASGLKDAFTYGSKFVGLPFQVLGKAADGLNAMSFGLWKMTSGLSTVTGLWRTFMAQVTKGEEFARVQYAFETMTKGIGLSLEGLRKSSGGLLDDKSLMKLSTFGGQAGMKASDIEMMTKRAQGASLVTGRDMSDIMRRMVMGVGKREREIMDELTVMMPNAALIWRDAAKKAGKGTDQLTEQEKTAAYIAAFEKSSRHLEKAANNLPESLTKVQKFQAGINNLMDQFSVKIMKMATDSGLLEKVGSIVGSALDGIANFFNESGIGEKLAEWMPHLSTILGGIGTAFGELAPLLEMIGPALEMIGNLVQGLLPAFSLLAQAVGVAAKVLLTAFNGALWAVAGSLELLVGWIPGVGDALSGLRVAAEKNVKIMADLEANNNKTSKSLADLKTKTHEVNGAFQTSITSLANLNNAMSAYASQAAAAGDAAEKMGRKLEAAIEVMKKGPKALAEMGGVTTMIAGIQEGHMMAQKEEMGLRGQLKQSGMADLYDKLAGAQAKEVDRWGKRGMEFTGPDGKPLELGAYGESPDEVALWGFVNAQGEKQNLTYEQLYKAIQEIEKGKQNTGKMAKEAAKLSTGLTLTDLDRIEQEGLEGFKVAMPIIKSEKYKPKSLQEVEGFTDRLNPGQQLSFNADMNEDEKARLLDALSVDPDARPGIDHPYSEAETRANIDTFVALANAREEETMRIRDELDRIQTMNDDEIMALHGASMSNEEVAVYRDQLMYGLRSTQDRLARQQVLAEELAARLKERLPPKRGSGGGSKKEEDRYILPDLIAKANDAMSEAEQVITGKSAYIADGFHAKLASEVADVVMLGYEENIELHTESLEDAAYRMSELAGQAVERGLSMGSIEEFQRMNAAFEAVIAAGEKSGVMDYVEKNEKWRKAIASYQERMALEAKQWEETTKFIEMTKQAAEGARLARIELDKKVSEYAIQDKEFSDTNVVSPWGTDAATGNFEEGAYRVGFNDLPAHLKRKAFDPRLAEKRKEIDRQIMDLRKAAEAEKAAIMQQFAMGGGVAAGVGGFMGALGDVDAKTKAQEEGLEADYAQQRMEKERQVITEYVAGLNQTYSDMADFVAVRFSGDLTYALVDAFSVWQNNTLTMTEDWTENMRMLLQDMVSSTGNQLAQFTEQLVMFETGSGIISKSAGAAVGGLFKGLMSLFRLKENREKEEKRAAEREMRRKETRKVAEFSVTVINQNTPVTHVVQQQMTKNLAAFLRAGGRLNGMGA